MKNKTAVYLTPYKLQILMEFLNAEIKHLEPLSNIIEVGRYVTELQYILDDVKEVYEQE